MSLGAQATGLPLPALPAGPRLPLHSPPPSPRSWSNRLTQVGHPPHQLASLVTRKGTGTQRATEQSGVPKEVAAPSHDPPGGTGTGRSRVPGEGDCAVTVNPVSNADENPTPLSQDAAGRGSHADRTGACGGPLLQGEAGTERAPAPPHRPLLRRVPAPVTSPPSYSGLGCRPWRPGPSALLPSSSSPCPALFCFSPCPLLLCQGTPAPPA